MSGLRGEVRLELSNKQSHDLRELLDGLPSGATFAERYVKGNSAIHLHLDTGVGWFGSGAHQWCAVLEAFPVSDLLLHDLGVALNHAETRAMRTRSRIADRGQRRMDDLVFVDIREVPEGGGDRILRPVPSFVRLRLLEDCPVFLGNAQERAFLGRFPGALGHRKGEGATSRSLLRSLAVPEDQLPDKVVERRADVVDKIAENHPESGRRVFIHDAIDDMPAALRVEIPHRSSDWLDVTVKEAADLPLKELGVLVCPLDLRPDARK